MLNDNLPGISVPLKKDPNGLLLLYDTGRSKWVSAARESIEYGIHHAHVNMDRYMRVGGVYSNVNGYLVRRAATLTSLAVRCKAAVNATFLVRKNGGTAVTSVALTGEVSKIVDNLDFSLTAGDWLQVFLQIDSGSVGYPIVFIEIAWTE